MRFHQSSFFIASTFFISSRSYAHSPKMTSRYFLAPKSKTACADIFIVPMFSDNYGYVIVDRSTKLAACIDPADFDPVIESLKSIPCDISALLCTHKHADHSGGNSAFASTFPGIKIVSTKYEETPSYTDLVGEGDEFFLGDLKVNVMYTPCHTRGHVVYVITGPSGSPILCSGDTLFVGGCGRFFEGTADDMLKNMDRLAELPADTLVCCAHEYTAANYKFLASVDAELCGAKYAAIQDMRAADEATVPSTIGDELATNLFMRCRDEKLQGLLGCSSPVDTMAKLREMKNNFR